MHKIFFIFLLTIASSIYSQDLENGTYQEFFDNKNPKYEISYLNGKKNGKEKFWYESGQLKIQSEFKNGKEHGLWQQWYENGTVRFFQTIFCTVNLPIRFVFTAHWVPKTFV